MANFSIVGVIKQKSFASISKSDAHNKREHDLPNADPERAHLNKHHVFHGKTVSEAVKNLLDKYNPFKRLNCKDPEQNSVLTLDYMLTASPEFFENASEKEIQKWVKKSQEWLIERHGDFIVSFDLHRDEKTPHIHAQAVPLDMQMKKNKKTGELEEKWSLNAKKWTGGKQKMNEMHDSYAAAMAEFGLVRGVKGSRAKHEKVKELYREINSNEDLKHEESVKEARGLFSIFRQGKTDGNWIKMAARTIKDLSSRVNDLLTERNLVNKTNDRLQKQLSGLLSYRAFIDSIIELTGYKQPEEALEEVRRALDSTAEERTIVYDKMRDMEQEMLEVRVNRDEYDNDVSLAADLITQEQNQKILELEGVITTRDQQLQMNSDGAKDQRISELERENLVLNKNVTGLKSQLREALELKS